MEKLGRVFFFGIAYAVMLAGMGVGIWALCRLVGMGLEFLRTGKVKKPDRTLSKHPLGGASLRAKASWLVCCLEEARWLLEDYNIPLPPQDRVEFLAKQKDIGPGDPFVGRQCSYFVAW